MSRLHRPVAAVARVAGAAQERCRWHSFQQEGSHGAGQPAGKSFKWFAVEPGGG